MSLLTSTNAGSASCAYFIENIGGPGTGVADAPVIKGTTLGTVVVGCGGPAKGLRLRGDTVANANAILGNQPNGGSLTIGNSVASFQNIALADGATTVNTPLTIDNGFGIIADGDINTGGNLVFTDGAAGKSISGYWSAQQAVAAAGAQANPAGLTQGTYLVAYAGAGAGNENAQPSGVFYWSGVSWVGNAVSFNFTAGAPNMAIGPVAGGATLNIGGAAVPLPGTLFFRKLMN